ncbi:AAA domain-containing protein [Mesomycoplasma hyorhinis]|uniref:AAA domain-containing protein n=1 Tax=Mesomycoplasma hyorhinis TaxID=2100 RepID=UPI00280C357C|nr:AAA domain-containing protein [Mesomycoplasma hyorhinis]
MATTLKFFYDETHWDRPIRSGVAKRSWGAFENDITLLSALEKSGEFDNVYPKIKNIKIKLRQFLKDFSDLEEYEVIRLNLKARTFANEFKDKEAQKKRLEFDGFVIIGKNKNIIKEWGKNTAALFFDIEFVKPASQYFLFQSPVSTLAIQYPVISINRISLLNFTHLNNPIHNSDFKPEFLLKTPENTSSFTSSDYIELIEFFSKRIPKILDIYNKPDLIDRFLFTCPKDSSKLCWNELLDLTQKHFLDKIKDNDKDFIFMEDNKSKNFNISEIHKEKFIIFSYSSDVATKSNLYLHDEKTGKDFPIKLHNLNEKLTIDEYLTHGQKYINTLENDITSYKVQKSELNEKYRENEEKWRKINREFEETKTQYNSLIQKINNNNQLLNKYLKINEEKENIEKRVIIPKTITQSKEEEVSKYKQRQRDAEIEYQNKIEEKNRQKQNKLVELEKIYNTIIDTFEEQSISIFSSFDTHDFLNEIKEFIVNNNQKKKEFEDQIKNSTNDFKIEEGKLLNIQNQLESEISKIDNNIESNENIFNSENTRIQSLKELKGIKTVYKNVTIKSRSKKSEDNEDFILNYYPISDFSKDKSSNIIFTLNDNQTGFITKIKRYLGAFANIYKGFYKNPYMVRSIFNPQTINSELLRNTQLEQSTKRKYHLNEKQELSVKKAIASRDVFYLQGPPGTGKTQTICAMAEEFIKRDENILITSSTHEAIENFMDRLNENNLNNPNYIIFKFDYNSKRSNDFQTSKIYPNFISKIEHWLENPQEENSILQEKILEIEEWIKKTNLDVEEYFGFSTYLDTLIERIEKNVVFEFEKEHLIKEGFDINNINSINNYYIERHKYIIKNNQVLSLIDALFELAKNNNINVWGVKNFKELKNKILNKDSTKNASFLKDLYKAYKENTNEKNNYLESNFNKFVFEHNLINVIGITTTASTKINLSDKNGVGVADVEPKDLFTEYPIGVVIIDEISKSSTPEIFARIILAEKVIFSGDYKQLPPSSEFEPNIINQIYDKLPEQPIQTYYQTDQYDDEEDWEFSYIKDKQFALKIEQLYKNSFFKTQANQLKNLNSNSTYEFLKTSHRFSQEIMDVVNVSYDFMEKLELPAQPRKFQGMSFEWAHDNLDAINPIIFDTSYLHDSYIRKLREKNVNIPIKASIPEMSSFYLFNHLQSSKSSATESFDQKSFIFRENFQEKNTGAVNEYNAEVIKKIVKKIIESNNKKQIYKNIQKEIGVICLTRNQSYLIKQIFNEDEIFKGIKVDTIDNFQGREKEIIIVDFIRAKNKLEDVPNSSIGEKRILSDIKRDTSFLNSNERINVAISRARNKLILVGAFRYYQSINSEILLRKIFNVFQQNKFTIINTEEQYEQD